MNISNNCYVEIHYALYNEAKEEVDGSRDGEPLPYIHGRKNIIPGLEQALEGRVAGDKFSVTIEPELGYGERDEEKISIIDAESFAGFDAITEGLMCQIEGADGQPQLVTITHIDDEEGEVTIDANHPFAGQTLNFEVEVISVREASEAELRDGLTG
ncbi:MAG: peptidylprolyl isomerase [Oceanospirillales bacterium]|jgi:FKBP-type peptidyl-prolyl cis-trans isomerase SlyD|uniref:FKBP-type peptidyl-prolyl cis-trans isomerase n=1 Tax=Amphritea sp. TaxID=1872502 RepID=UPI001D2510EB|nr:peptidylprolyl isomerase [Oceanospirillales bacterium]MBR9886868.1 peptidylprolyl isomerase [Oceanospirillales bacterium]